MKKLFLTLIFTLVTLFSYSQQNYSTLNGDFKVFYENKGVLLEIPNQTTIYLLTSGQWKFSTKAFQKLMAETNTKIEENKNKAKLYNITNVETPIKIGSTPNAKRLQGTAEWQRGSTLTYTVSTGWKFKNGESIIEIIYWCENRNGTYANTSVIMNKEQFQNFIKLIDQDYIKQRQESNKNIKEMFK